ncbi:hypothetical protein [Halomicrobium urmianum]|uniref:hypothetical protein n=1 Tax=Halomicrobium urmianum TaxID=1586233 RepID=UPI001CD996CD|nr:hypothetical protein [Halomicrobium urmianum]
MPRLTTVRTGVVVVLACVLLASVGTAQVTADCAGDGDGALFVADGGLTVEHAAGTSVSEGETYRNASALRFGNVTVVARGPASLRLDAVGGTVCAVDVNASETPIRIATDGQPAITVSGRASAFAVGQVSTDDPSDADVAYEAADPIGVTLGPPDGSTDRLVAVDVATSETVAMSTDDPATLSLPAGRHRIAFVAATTTVEPSSTGSPRGDSTATGGTATATGPATTATGDDATRTAESGSRATPTQRATTTARGTTTTGSGPGFGGLAALTGFAGAVLLGIRRRKPR